MLKISVETVLAQQGCEEPEINNDSEQIGLSRRGVSPYCDQKLSLYMFEITRNPIIIIITCDLAKFLL